jgi:hypothetical protein
MHFQFDMSALAFPTVASASAAAEPQEILRQMLEVQKEQLGFLRAILGAHDGVARWRAFVERWRGDFPDLARACRQVLPILERSYGKLITELTENLNQDGSEALENEFALQEFLDRYGIRLTQLGTILNLVAPFAEVGSQSETSNQ